MATFNFDGITSRGFKMFGKYSITSTSKTNSVLKVDITLKAPYNIKTKSTIIGMVFAFAYGPSNNKLEAILSAKKGAFGWDKYGAKSNMTLSNFKNDPMNAYLNARRDPHVWTEVKSTFSSGNTMKLVASRQFDVRNDD